MGNVRVPLRQRHSGFIFRLLAGNATALTRGSAPAADPIPPRTKGRRREIFFPEEVFGASAAPFP
jgi:hypothetical protein